MPTKIDDPLKAIRRYCKECVGRKHKTGSATSLTRACEDNQCLLWPWREGKEPR